MKVKRLEISDVLLIEPRIFHDARGFFLESFNEESFRAVTGVQPRFVQDNQSRSVRHVLRGLHYQAAPMAQGKLVRVVRGTVFDVAVDLRPDSPHFGKWVSTTLSEDDNRQIWIPAGFAHGFQAMSEFADVTYKLTEFYSPAHERCLRWDDRDLAIPWPCNRPILSEKDGAGCTLAHVHNAVVV